MGDPLFPSELVVRPSCPLWNGLTMYYLGDILPINSDAASPHVIEAKQQAKDGTFPRARGPHLSKERRRGAVLTHIQPVERNGKRGEIPRVQPLL